MKYPRADQQPQTSTQSPTSNLISKIDQHQPSNRRPALFIVLACFLSILLFTTSGGSAQAPEWTPVWININDPVHANKLDPSIAEAPPGGEKGSSNALLDFVNSVFSSLSQSISPPSALTDGWVTIFSDDFEGAFPGDWDVFDNDGSVYGTYYWDKSNCRASEGSYSAWAVGGGVNGDGLSCGSNYPNYAKSWMIYGPFSLEDATAAEVNFKLWLYSESGYDNFLIVASINGTNFSGFSTSGNSNGWSEYTFDLTDVPSLGNLTGESQVWIAFIFVSDESDNYAEGAYVDTVVLRKYVQDIPTDTPTSTPTGSVTPTSTPTLTPTPPIAPLPMVNYIPVVINRYPITPIAPVLNAISNDDGDGSYSVSWTSVAGATSYLLQEDDNSSFSSPTTAYEGSGTSKSISGKPVGTYYYRVRAINDYATSGWSNVRSVVVSVAQPPCPQTGHWTGMATNNMQIRLSFDVVDSPQCQIETGTLKITAYLSPCGILTTTFTKSFPIYNSYFVTGPFLYYSTTVEGTFSSSTTVEGNLIVSMFNVELQRWCKWEDTWRASP